MGEMTEDYIRVAQMLSGPIVSAGFVPQGSLKVIVTDASKFTMRSAC